MKHYVLLLLFLLSYQLEVFARQKIFLLHGYGCPKLVMNKLEKRLRKANFTTENFGYSSMIDHLDSLGIYLYRRVKTSGIDTVSFVTHSMGGLIVRSMLQYANQDANFPKIFRIVMLAPPNTGAEIANFWSAKSLRWLTGPNVRLMRTDSNSYARRLPLPINTELAIIAGQRGHKIGYNPFIKGDNDGLLTPARTRLGIEKIALTLKIDHTFIVVQNKVCRLVVEFMRTGGMTP
jgi:triacylglycerol lipase